MHLQLRPVVLTGGYQTAGAEECQPMWALSCAPMIKVTNNG